MTKKGPRQAKASTCSDAPAAPPGALGTGAGVGRVAPTQVVSWLHLSWAAMPDQQPPPWMAGLRRAARGGRRRAAVKRSGRAARGATQSGPFVVAVLARRSRPAYDFHCHRPQSGSTQQVAWQSSADASPALECVRPSHCVLLEKGNRGRSVEGSKKCTRTGSQRLIETEGEGGTPRSTVETTAGGRKIRPFQEQYNLTNKSEEALREMAEIGRD